MFENCKEFVPELAIENILKNLVEVVDQKMNKTKQPRIHNKTKRNDAAILDFQFSEPILASFRIMFCS
mgnify:FL=1